MATASHPAPRPPETAGSTPAETRGREFTSRASVLVVDDEPGMRNFLSRALAKRCALLEVAESAETAEALRSRYHFDLMIVDIRLPGHSGLEWLEQLRTRDVQTDVIMMTAYADMDTAIAALRAGAADFILKPFRIEQMMAAVQRCLERRQIARDNFLLRRDAPERGIEGIVGGSEAIRDLCGVIKRIAPSTATVLIEGETGTGKELVAGAVHALSGRPGSFVPVNCGSIPPELLESELFGHTKGAFTGAHTTREGLFIYANHGTLFLDEIAEMPRAMQAKLLRSIEAKRIRPVGADRETAIDVRVLTATNRELAREVERGAFREDLYFRLNVVTLRAPPLRERPEDVPALVAHFSRSLARELALAPLPFAHDDMAKLQAYPWPGNVRELKNVVERSLLLGRLPEEFLASDGAAPVAARAGAYAIELPLAEVEKRHMQRVLESVGGNKSEAARRLGVSRKTLERKTKLWRDGHG